MSGFFYSQKSVGAKIKMVKSHALRMGWAIVIAIALATTFFSYFYLLKPQSSFYWDEAHHSLNGISISLSIENGDLSAFFQNTNRQVYWPFLHSWWLAIFFLIAGPSYESARFSSLIMFFILNLLLYFLGTRIDKIRGIGIGILSVLLLIASPLMLFLFTAAMVEPLACVLTGFFILFFWRGEARHSRRDYLLSGIFLALLYLSKYIYSFFIGVGLVVYIISLFFFPGKDENGKISTKKGYYWWIAAGFFPIYFTWIIQPPHWAKIKIVLDRVLETGGWNPLQLGLGDRLFYYIRSLFLMYSFSWAIGLIFLATLIWSFFHLKKLKVRFLLFIFLADFIPMTLGGNKQDRFIATLFPALILLSADFLTWVWNKVPRWWRYCGAGVLALIIIGDIGKMPSYIRQIANETIGSPIYRIPQARRIPTFFGLTPYPSIISQPIGYLNPDARDNIAQYNIRDLISSLTEEIGNESLCSAVSLNELSPHLWQWMAVTGRKSWFNQWNPNCIYFLSLAIDDSSPYYTMANKGLITGQNQKWNDFLRQNYRQGKLKLKTQWKWGNEGLKIIIYEHI